VAHVAKQPVERVARSDRDLPDVRFGQRRESALVEQATDFRRSSDVVTLALPILLFVGKLALLRVLNGGEEARRS
jgi:hypothetical protein